MHQTGREGDDGCLRNLWIACSSESVALLGLRHALRDEWRLWSGPEPPDDASLSCVICSHADGARGMAERVRRVRRLVSESPIVVFGPTLDLPAAHVALEAGARGFIHAGMRPDQVRRAVGLAAEGEVVAPRKLLEYLVGGEGTQGVDLLSHRQREILQLVVEGLSNAEIARRLYLSESTVKQHLRAAYKLLGVSNRTEAAARLRGSV